MEAQTIDVAAAAVVTAALSCFNCTLNLTGHRYILRDDKPFCIKCYEQLFANRCEECKEVIGTDFKVRAYNVTPHGAVWGGKVPSCWIIVHAMI
jgi:hypothetical protein